MRYAFISDIHANIQALDAVFDDIDSQNIDCLICLGDIVGYGPSPAEVIDKLKNTATEFVLGNHDAAVAGYIRTSNFNDNARISLEWTINSLDKKYREFLGKQPLEIRFENLRFSHASFDNSAEFSYLIEPEDAAASFAACTEQLLFSGHTHIPGIFVIGSRKVPHWLPPVDFGIEPEKRYIINVGSVGLPRDNDPRASYCIYDSDKGDIFFRKVKFDVFKFKKLLTEYNLPADFEFFNYAVKEHTSKEYHTFQPPVPHESFSPLDEKETQRLYAKIQDLDKQLNSIRRMQKTFILLISSLIIIFSLSVLILFLYPKLTDRYEINTIPARKNLLPNFITDKTGNILPAPKIFGKISAGNPSDYYSFTLYDKSQKVNIIKTEDSKHNSVPAFEILSENSDKPVIITSACFKADKNSRFKIGMQLKPSNASEIAFRIALEYHGSDNKWHSVLEKYVSDLKNRKRWTTTSATMPKKHLLKSPVTLRYNIELRFRGSLLIRKCTIIKK